VSVIVAAEVDFTIIPKKLNMNKRGVVPAVIRGTKELDVGDINQDNKPFSIKLDLASGDEIPVKSAKTPGHSNRINLKLDAQDIISEIIAVFEEINKGDVIKLYLTGELSDGKPIFGEDVVIITGQPKPPKPPKK
jgi:hypothetical protein